MRWTQILRGVSAKTLAKLDEIEAAACRSDANGHIRRACRLINQAAGLEAEARTRRTQIGQEGQGERR